MADNIAIYLVRQRTHHTLDGRVPELPNRATARTDRVVVVFDTSDAVHRGAIEDRQFAKCACIYQVTDGTVNGRPANPGQVPAQLLGCERATHLLNTTSYGDPGHGPAQAAVFQRIAQVNPD